MAGPELFVLTIDIYRISKSISRDIAIVFYCNATFFQSKKVLRKEYSCNLFFSRTVKNEAICVSG
jgi:hypothetical protein